MISRTKFYNNVKTSTNDYANQKSNGKGKGNLFVGGSGKDTVINDTDASLILGGDGADTITSTGTQNIIEGGEGNDTIVSTGNSNAITAGAGDDTVISDGNNNVIAGNAGEDKIKSTGNYNFVSGGAGNDIIVTTGDHNIAGGDAGDDTIQSKGNYNLISGGDGNDAIVSIGNYNTIGGGAGNDKVLAIGDYGIIDLGQGDNKVAFWGDNYDISGGTGINKAESLDYALRNKEYLDYASYVEADTKKTSSEIKTNTQLTEYDMAKLKAEIAKKYNLSAQEIATLNGLDLNAKYSDGSPLYAIAASIRHPGQYVIVQRDSSTHSWGVTEHECIATNNTWNNDVIANAGTTTTTNTTKTTTNYTIDGLSNINVNFGDNSDTVHITSKDNVHVQIGACTDEQAKQKYDVILNNGYSFTGVDVKTDKVTSDAGFGILTSGATHTSPLIIDFNQDGVVSATAGKGIDLDNNGSADGCASNGDKMLAMTDLNGNGKIDGAEVFGDQTVDPFTGEKLNAANGFEALAMVAKSAEKFTGVNCIDANGKVDLNKLNEALQTKGITLGFVSDENNTTVEKLSKVASIDTANYIEKEDSGDAQHRQLGTATFEDGSSNKVDDVWFTLTGIEENPFNTKSFLKALSA